MTESPSCRSNPRRACTCSAAPAGSAQPIAHRIGSEAWLRELADRHRRDVHAVAASDPQAIHDCSPGHNCRPAQSCRSHHTTCERTLP